MSENSLKIRGKFINKLASKLEDLTDDVELLSKVDKKIFKKLNRNLSKQLGGSQIGGEDADLKAIQIATLKKKLELEAQKKKIEKAVTDATALKDKIGEINAALLGLKTTIDAFDMKLPDLESIQLNIQYLKQDQLDKLTAAVSANTPWADFDNGDTKPVATLVTKEIYEQLVPPVQPQVQ